MNKGDKVRFKPEFADRFGNDIFIVIFANGDEIMIESTTNKSKLFFLSSDFVELLHFNSPVELLTINQN